MFGSRRLAKRSIVGTKVSALYQDGRYYTGVIQSQISEDPRQTLQLFSVKFEDGSVKSVTANNIIGQGFESVQNKNLRTGQKVYITLNGREVSGTVLVHDGVSDEVLISLEQVPGESKQILRMIDEIRLLESRKSARLSDQDTDYSKLADFNTDSKRRTVSHFIDVPSQKQRHRDRVEIDDLDDLDVEMEDESIAVAALTNLSCSPASPLFPASFNDREVLPIGSHSYRESGHLSSSVASSGFYSGLSEGNDRSPPFKTHFSESAPDRVFFEASPTDDCLDLEEDVKHFYDDDVPKDQKSKQGGTLGKLLGR
ncbi:hypothetical protein LOTGIDRAFT_239410 [Lottia gigantea]|uniref:DUF4772 domain-containing protein n=1 Tax=Lottia gigantea TaxID=225164 RepID=V4C297_LOTGI|nr:hypothetical protein LOTGIDRAFT_239410 [Lottia gigantea]ESO95619.1 hypothetical protein LOTGIDRAFT_239410 [Lottia gigantea]